MGAIIYSGIDGIEVPKLSFEDFPKYERECEKYIKALRTYCIISNSEIIIKLGESGRGDIADCIGETIKFQVPDGYAQYMVASLKPLELIHINIMDGWESEFAELLTLKKVVELVKKEKKLKTMFM